MHSLVDRLSFRKLNFQLNFEFSRKLLTHLQSLETMGNLIPTKKFIDVLRHCIDRNLVIEEGKGRPAIRKNKNFKTRQQNTTK